jgi:hypothetical protein
MVTIKRMIKAMASRWRKSVRSQERRCAGTSEVCPHCGARFAPSRLSLREMGLAAICGVLLLSILLPVSWIAKRWIERQEDRFLDHMYWYEPLDSRRL